MIIFFSGTGNTRLAAHALGRMCLDSNFVELSGEVLLNPEKFSLDSLRKDSDKFIVWCFPTYSWGVPPVIARFIKQIGDAAFARTLPHFMLTTCGDDIGLTDRQWRHLMKIRGWKAMNAFTVPMPNTYTLMKGFDVDSPEIEQEKLKRMTAVVHGIAEVITSQAPDRRTDMHRGKFAWVKSRIIYPWFKRFCMSPKPFHSTGGCVGCGLCSRECPMKNITMQGTRRDGMHPVWSEQCALCLRCYHVCPHHAVAYGHATDGKGQYLAPKA